MTWEVNYDTSSEIIKVENELNFDLIRDDSSELFNDDTDIYLCRNGDDSDVRPHYPTMYGK